MWQPHPLIQADHVLTGDWSSHRECHVGGDFLLIYQLHGKARKFFVF
jgi:mRNA interferase YafQ